jgi:tetratricopeptide (TPR) repeat protein
MVYIKVFGYYVIFAIRLTQMKRLLLLWISIAVICPEKGTAQSEIDSLKNVLLSGQADSSNIDTYLLLNTKIQGDTTAAQQYLMLAIALAKKIDDHNRLIRCYRRLATFYDYNGDFRNARKALAKMNEHLPYARNNKPRAVYFMYIGIMDYREGVYDKALENFWIALRLFESLNDSVSVASCYLNIGNSYKELKDYTNTLKYYLLGLKIYESSNNEALTAMAYGNIGNVYKNRNDYDSALYYYNRSLGVNRRLHLKEDIQIDLDNIGNIYLKYKDYSKAMSCFKESYELSKAIGFELGIVRAILNMGTVTMERGEHAKALRFFTEAQQKAKKQKYSPELRESYEMISLCYERMKDFNGALAFRKKFEILKDSLLNEAYLKNAKEQELKYETEKKDNQIELLAKERELSEREAERQATLKNIFIAGSIFMFFIAFLIFYLFKQRLRNQSIIANKNAELKEISFTKQATDLEMKALRAQINPHFLFNCMNSINQMIVRNENDKASLYLAKFSKLVRLIVENANATKVLLEDELALLEAYIQMESLRFAGKIHYQIDVAPGVDRSATYIPSMVLQPFVENAIWHGLMHKEDPKDGLIRLAISERDDMLVCSIEDNGVGMERSKQLQEKSLLKKKSVGMAITEERLKLLTKGRLQEFIKIADVRDSLDRVLGTQVQVSIPLF